MSKSPSTPPRAATIPKFRRDADGRALCRWCGKPVPKGRRKWCSQACVDEALIRAWPSKARELVFKRDKGVCAECGFDCDLAEKELKRAIHWAHSFQHFAEFRDRMKIRHGFTPEAAERNPGRDDWHFERVAGPRHPAAARVMAIEARVRRLLVRRARALAKWHADRGFHINIPSNPDQPPSRPQVSFWQADHIVPVEHGGGSCGLENYQTLCHTCHNRKTARQAADRAKARREAREAADPQGRLAL